MNGVFEQFPYTNFHNLNLDWILKTMKEQVATVEVFRNELAEKENSSNITNNRKLSETGNFTGSWYGFDKPIASDPGIANEVAKLMPIVESVTLYINPTFGEDTNNGDYSHPFKTLTHALSTLNKNIQNVDVKIRLLAGDYTDEGVVWINNFYGRRLIITAFDGVNDIKTAGDIVTIAGLRLDDCQEVNIWGLKVVNPTPTTYGIFVSTCKYVYISGYKNTDSTVVNSGIGITQGSTVIIENCYCKNKSAVVSCNYGSIALSKDWNADSSNVDIGLTAHYGSTIFQSGVQPTATINVQEELGGKVFAEVFTGQPLVNYYRTFVSRNATTTTNWVVPINLPNAPKWIAVKACISSTPMSSDGAYNAGSIYEVAGSSCIYTDSSNNKNVAYDLVQINNGATTTTLNVSAISNTGITLAQVGGTITGTLILQVECGF